MTEPGGARAPLPDGTIVLHIGPHKTGTTSLQAALWAAREPMQRQGVRLAGRSRNPVGAARAVTGQSSPYSDKPPSMREWRQLVEDVADAREPRVVVSSEFFAHADDEAARHVIDDLGRGRVHVVVTLRPLARIIPSMWQQNVQAGIQPSFDRWLHGLFPPPPGPSTAPFWTLHRHDALIDRWAAAAGSGNVTAVVVDDLDHAMVLRVLERLLGLEPETLGLQPDLANRALTLEETEAIRAFNKAFRRAGLDRALHARLVRYGAAAHMKAREPGLPATRIELPAWAIPRVADASQAIVDGITRSGVAIVGDLPSLAWTPGHDAEPGGSEVARTEATPDPTTVSPDVAAALSMGILVAAGIAPRDRRVDDATAAGDRSPADDVPTYQVAGTIAVRGQRVLIDRLRRVRRAVGDRLR